MIRRIHAEHVPCERRPGESLRHDIGARRQGRVHVLGQPRIVKSGARLIVTDDEPGGVPVGQLHLLDRADLADLGENWERVVPVVGPPCRQCIRHQRSLLARLVPMWTGIWTPTSDPEGRVTIAGWSILAR